MIAVDTNVLLHSHRVESPLHEICHARVRALAEGDAVWALPIFCLAEFVRVATHLRVFTPPSSLRDALDYLDTVAASPSVRLLLPGPAFPQVFRRVCESAGVRGNLAFDAQIAAVCVEQGVHKILTTDRDFTRFPDLEAELAHG